MKPTLKPILNNLPERMKQSVSTVFLGPQKTQDDKLEPENRTSVHANLAKGVGVTAAASAMAACTSGVPRSPSPAPNPEPTTPPVGNTTISKASASRFLMQSTLGANEALINQVASSGATSWLDTQLNQPLDSATRYQDLTNNIWQQFRQDFLATYGEAAINGEGNNPALPYKWYFHMAWWHTNLNEMTHLLRQRVALALSELLVISDNSALELDSVGMASYYDLLYKHAFGNYNDLLYDVSLHPCMGVYLSHMNNQKAKPAENIHPDENYAREIMQLFSIGLFELNTDGSHKKDSQGNDIPTYKNDDIRTLARVFTGLKAASYDFEWATSYWPSYFNGSPVSFDDGVDKSYKTVPYVNMTQPMTAEESYHDSEAKNLLNGRIALEANQSAASEIRSAVNQLVAHPNTAPFVAKHLIQQLVTANPSAEYIEAVAKKFGSKGNLKAMVREILTYPLTDLPAKVRLTSARVKDGKLIQSQLLKSPVLRMTQLMRAFDVKNDSGKLWLIGDDISETLQQHPLSSPTVFNFYQNDFAPHGEISNRNLVAPRFQLHNAATSIAYVNQIYYALFGSFMPAISTRINQDTSIQNAPELDPRILNQIDADRLRLNFARYQAQAADPAQHDVLIDRLSLLLTGDAPVANKAAIKSAFSSYANNPDWVLQTIVFFIVISPGFTVLAG